MIQKVMEVYVLYSVENESMQGGQVQQWRAEEEMVRVGVRSGVPNWSATV